MKKQNSKIQQAMDAAMQALLESEVEAACNPEIKAMLDKEYRAYIKGAPFKKALKLKVMNYVDDMVQDVFDDEMEQHGDMHSELSEIIYEAASSYMKKCKITIKGK